MLTPEYLEELPKNMIELYAQAEEDILMDMARRICQYDYWIPAAEHQRKKLFEMGMVQHEIIDRMKENTGRSEQELKQLMKDAGIKTLDDDSQVYQSAGLNPPPLMASPTLKKVLDAGYRTTNKTFTNLTKTTANTATKQFEDALDRAWMQIQTGGFDYNTAIRSAIKDLSEKGIGAIRYPSGHTDTIEVAVRRAVVTGVNKSCAELQIARMEELKWSLVEVSAHAGARPEHAKWQGKVYSYSGESPQYASLKEATGYGTGSGLCGWNCRHSFRPYREGSPLTYSDALLKSYEEKKYQYKGRNLTEYEASQMQRKIERNIRRWKREEKAMAAAGLDTSEARSKVAKWRKIQTEFLKETGLKADETRTMIAPYASTDIRKNLQKEAARSKIESAEDAQTFSELKSYMKQSYGIDVSDSVGALDFQSVREGIQGIEYIINEFQQAKTSFRTIGTEKNGLMCAGYDGDINFNPGYYQTRESALNAHGIGEGTTQSGLHPKGNNCFGSGAHEAGHILEKALADKINGESGIGKLMWKDSTYARAVVSDACKQVKKLPECKGMTVSALKNQISRYAGEMSKYNASETLAEAVCDIALNGEDAALLSKIIWEILKKELG